MWLVSVCAAGGLDSGGEECAGGATGAFSTARGSVGWLCLEAFDNADGSISLFKTDVPLHGM